MAEARAFGTIAVCGVAALLGQTGVLTLLAGVTLPLDRIVDHVFDHHDRKKRQQLRTLCGCLADELDHLVPDDAGMRESVRAEAERLLGRFGPGDRDFVERYGMNAEAVAEALLADTTWRGTDRRDLGPALRGVLTCFYERLPQHRGMLDGLLPHTQRALLAIAMRTERKVDALQQQLVANAESQKLARESGIREGMLIALARRHAEGDPDSFDAALKGLERALEVAAGEKKRGRLPSNLPGAVNAVIERIDELNEQGDLDAGRQALDAELAALAEEEARRQAAILRLHGKGLAQAILMRDVAGAHRHALAMHDLEADLADQQAAHDSLRALFIEWFERGRDKGLNLDLEVAIAIARTRAGRAATPDQRASAANDLGVALRALGERESGTKALRMAASVFRDVLGEWTGERAPQERAMALNNLGSVLATLGEREGNAETLRKAASAFRDALGEYTRERAPLRWAATRNNLGNVLATLGGRENDSETLRQAASAFRDVLGEWTRERVPQDWATAQNNLGNALLALGQREGDADTLRRAASAYRDALKERTRKRVPLLWARTRNNLGNALLGLGQHEDGAETLRQAAFAYRDALEEITRKRSPLEWAMTRTNLGIALALLGERENSADSLEQALAAIRGAREVFIDEAGLLHHQPVFDQRIAAIEHALAAMRRA